MSEKNKQYLIFAVMTVVIALMTTVAALYGVPVVLPQPPAPESRGFATLSREDIQWAVIDKLTVINGSEMRGDASVAGGLTVAGNLAVSGAQATGTTIILEGGTVDDNETTVTLVDPSGDNTQTLPNVSGTLHVNEATQPLIASTATIGGGWSVGGGGSGCTLSAAGGIGSDATAYFGGTLGVTGAVTATGSLTTDSLLSVGGGYSYGGGGSGCTITAAGNVGCDGTGYFLGTLGVTGAVTTTGALDVGGTLNYGTNNLYAVGHATTGKAIVAATVSTSAEGYVAVVHGLTGVDAVIVSLCQGPTTTVGSASAIITGTTVTVHTWDLAAPTKTGAAGSVCYQVIGTK